MSDHDVIVIGAGHNGLVAAARLARAGLRTLVVEGRKVVGGACVTDEFHPGFRVSTLAHAAQPAASIVDELRLSQYGLELIDPDPYVFAPLPDGRRLILTRDPSATTASISQFSAADARNYAEFRSTLSRIGSFIADLLTTAPPDIEHPQRSDLWSLLKAARRFRALGRKDAYRLLRWAPMSVADFASEWFESDPLRAVIAGSGIFGTALGPRSAGGTAVLLMQVATGGGIPRFVRGGLGAFTSALEAAARAAGADIRVDVPVGRIDVENGSVKGVTLTTGEKLGAPIVVSNADPRRTLLGLIDPVELEPAFLARVRSYRAFGSVAKVNLALRELPRFTSLASVEDVRLLSGLIHIGPDTDYLEHAFDTSKYGAWSARPYLDITIPSLTDPGLAPPGGHVMSINAQFAPYRLRGSDWAASSEAFGETVIETLAEYVPDIRRSIVHRQIITPADLESTYGMTGGHIFHGEMALDQIFTMRPLLGWAQYRMPIGGLYLCGAGTHPGYGVSGLSGWNAAREVLRGSRKG
jgi:phytoene dehydrogenase-like protein